MIENLDYKDLIKRYDRKGTFFYLDPPYYKAPYYKYNMELNDYVDMCEVLKNIQGKFLLSLNDHFDIRDVFSDFTIDTVGTLYSVASKENPKKVNELLIRNY